MKRQFWMLPLFNKQIQKQVRNLVIYIHAIKLINQHPSKNFSELSQWENLFKYVNKIKEFKTKKFKSVISEEISRATKCEVRLKSLKTQFMKLEKSSISDLGKLRKRMSMKNLMQIRKDFKVVKQGIIQHNKAIQVYKKAILGSQNNKKEYLLSFPSPSTPS